MAINPPAADRIVRCAIYTRKSTEAGLDQAVNSLDTQRGVCQAYIKCHAHRNWVELPHRYDDGGYSGGNLERPALKRMISDIEAGRIDIVVIYKIDRLSRSLPDFIRLMDVLDSYGASFVSVTQTFDTSDSMGRMVLNILLTFAQFERELMSDRVRDKKAAMRRRGLFTGGTPPAGYTRAAGGKLVLDPGWARIVREIFVRFPTVSAAQLTRDLNARGILTRRFKSKAGKSHGGQKLWPRSIYYILNNPIYTGHFVHRDEWMKADIEPIVSREEWDLAQSVLRTRFPQVRDTIHNFLLGILHDEQGRRMRLQRGIGRASNYRYYKSEHAGWARASVHKRVMVDADRVEALAVSTLQAMLVDRPQLRQAILSLGLYSDEIGRLLKRGDLAARRIALMDRIHLREAFLALVPRIDVDRSGLRMLVSCYELRQFLAWDGSGIFRKSVLKPVHGADRFRMVYAPAFLICGHPQFALPIQPRGPVASSPDPHLVGLLELAAELRAHMLANRTKSIAELAREKRMGANYFARVLRLNYLAPDIQTAIFDGTQPPGLSRHSMLYSSLPLDWGQQRRLMGFN